MTMNTSSVEATWSMFDRDNREIIHRYQLSRLSFFLNGLPKEWLARHGYSIRNDLTDEVILAADNVNQTFKELKIDQENYYGHEYGSDE